MLTGRRLPKHSPNAIKAKQAGFRAQPEITVRSLCDGVNGPLGKTVTHRPGGMGVLADVE